MPLPKELGSAIVDDYQDVTPTALLRQGRYPRMAKTLVLEFVIFQTTSGVRARMFGAKVSVTGL